jgi:2-oxoglutarate dehydrogenase E1 component
VLETDPLPLVVMTPKSLLRHPFTASAPAELADGRFMRVIDDAVTAVQPTKVRRIVFCSGKIAVDLFTSERRADNPHVAVIRVEQLYPFPADLIKDVLGRYSNGREVCWVQEEPENMGAWEFIRSHLQEVGAGRPIRRIARPRSASPAEGSAARHTLNQQALVNQAFGAPPETGGRVTEKGRRDAALTGSKG